MRIRTPIKPIALIVILFVYMNISADDFKPKIGLVLSGGGAKGLAHVAVLKLLDSLEIPVDYIAGTSMGGLIGALYAIGYSGHEIEDIIRQTAWDELFTDQPHRNLLPYSQRQEVGRYQISLGLDGFTPVIPSGLISGQKISMLFGHLTHAYSGLRNFDDLPVPLRCVAVDLVTGNEVVIDSGSLPKAMRATMSIPSIFSPVEWGDSLLIDGGIVNNFPVDVARKMGAQVVIGVNVGTPLKQKNELKNMVDVFEQSFFLSGEQKVEINKSATDILISPELSDFSNVDFTVEDVMVIVKRGEKAAHDKISELMKLKKLYNLQKVNFKKDKISQRVIYSLNIRGNRSISFTFIYNYLGLLPGQILDMDKLEERITDLYALGYFDNIEYELENKERGRVAVTIIIREKPLKQLHLGFHYDDFHQFVVALSISGSDIFIQGLRFENELQFAGVRRFNLQLYLQSRGYNFPVYPLLRFYYKDDPVNIYDIRGPKIASYRDRSVTLMGGLGISPFRSFNISCAFAVELMNIKPDIALFDPERFPRFRDKLHQIQIHSEIDVIDDILLPRKGFRLNGMYENGLKKLNSEIEYYRLELSGEIYLTAAQQHTFMIAGAHVNTGQNLPIYKAYYLGGAETFVGLDYGQLITDHAYILRFFYRYEYKKDIFFKILYNAAFDYRISDVRPPAGYLLSGYGIAVKFMSIIGPLEITYARSEFSPYRPGEKQNNIYVTAGYKL